MIKIYFAEEGLALKDLADLMILLSEMNKLKLSLRQEELLACRNLLELQ